MRRYGLIKSGLDAHTLGMHNVAQLLESCAFSAFIADAKVTHAIDTISDPASFEAFKKWILDKNITCLGFSYRLDPQQALQVFGKIVYYIDKDRDLCPKQKGCLREIYFAGLPESCAQIEKEFGARFQTFRGDETPAETLEKLGIPSNLIPKALHKISLYDELRLDFGKDLINREKQFSIPPFKEYSYREYGTLQDLLVKRLDYAKKLNLLPLTRVHAGPYLKDREKALALFSQWLKKLSKSGYLDIISIGSSQLSQSRFGEDWGDLPNGGGIPINSELELRAVSEDAAPMLVRAYSATKNIATSARIFENHLNMAWHALSLWWFNRLDGRGPLSLRQSLGEHIETLKYIAKAGKPYEPNTPHHFAFRGSDDITYVASAYLAARTAKRLGIRHLVLQNMLNTPKSTWGLRDLVKSRVLLRLVRSLEDENFRVIYQPRAGLDYFSPDKERAKNQLAAVSALMSDIEPEKKNSPEIIHVVSYSEALFLANPDVINESIQITKAALKFYPEFRQINSISDLTLSIDVDEEALEMWDEARRLIEDMEINIKGLYTGDGLYKAFKMGYLPVPHLWECREDFPHAVDWTTKTINGGVHIVDEYGKKMPLRKRLARIRNLNAVRNNS